MAFPSTQSHHHTVNFNPAIGYSNLRSVRPFSTQKGRPLVVTRAQKESNAEKPDPGLGLKAVWVGAENFGKIIGLTKGDKKAKAQQAQRKMSRQEVIDSIRADYDVNYFVSGNGEMEAYDPDCLFADPFAGFNGTERFKQNVSNLGGLMENIELDILKFEEKEHEVITKWRFSALLQLPWRPRLAAAGGTTHVLDQETGKVVKHIESWDIEPGKVVKQLLRPARKDPANNTEKFMLALSEGDVKNMWLASSLGGLIVAAPLLLLTQITSSLSGHENTGFFGFLQAASTIVFIAAGSAQIYKFATGGSTFK